MFFHCYDLFIDKRYNVKVYYVVYLSRYLTLRNTLSHFLFFFEEFLLQYLLKHAIKREHAYRGLKIQHYVIEVVDIGSFDVYQV